MSTTAPGPIRFQPITTLGDPKATPPTQDVLGDATHRLVGIEDHFNKLSTDIANSAGGKTTAKGFGIDVASAALGSLPATGVGIGTLLTQLQTKKMVKDSGAAAVAQISRDVKNSKSKALLPLAIVTMLAAVGGFFATMGSKAAKRVV